MTILIPRQLLLFFIALIVAFIASQGGISGAFLMVPTQMYLLGMASPVISSTNYLYNILGIPATLYRYVREHRMLMPLTLTLMVSTCPGAIIGTYLRVTYLSGYETFRYLVAAVLIALSIYLLITVFRVRDSRKPLKAEVIAATLRKVSFKYGEEVLSFSPLRAALVSFIVGIVSGAYGIGGAAFLSPILIGLFGMPAYAITGSTLTSDLFVSIVSASSYAILRTPPNLINGVCMGLGALIGMYLSTGVQRRIPENVIKAIVSMVTLLIGLFQLIL